ncbi:hypothetical protein KR222_004002, partial [Zaprionus bogoriensis]
MRTLQIIIILFVLCAELATAQAVCELSLRSPLPIVVKRFGSKTAILKSSIQSIKLLANETIVFHCPAGLTISDDNDYRSRNPTQINVATAELRCGEKGIELDETMIVQRMQRGVVHCNTAIGQTLYESRRSLAGCESDAMTLLVGHRLEAPGLVELKQLAMCYDLATMHLRFASFLAYPAHNMLLDASEQRRDLELDTLQLDTYVGSLDAYFGSSRSSSQVRSLLVESGKRQLGVLFDAEHFESASLLQDEQQRKQLAEYESMLSIVWYRSLRTGNWKRFLDALRAATATGSLKFELRIGVSGVVEMPRTCNASSSSNRRLQFESNIDLPVLSVPAHIWAHVRQLQPSRGSSSSNGSSSAADEFVVVAHNSPYANIVELSTFCSDICTEIPWLRDTSFVQLHLLPLYGVVHCCRLSDVLQLRDFP